MIMLYPSYQTMVAVGAVLISYFTFMAPEAWSLRQFVAHVPAQSELHFHFSNTSTIMTCETSQNFALTNDRITGARYGYPITAGIEDFSNTPSTNNSAASRTVEPAVQFTVPTASEVHKITEPTHRTLSTRSQEKTIAHEIEVLTWSSWPLARYHDWQKWFENTTFTLLDYPPFWQFILFGGCLLTCLGITWAALFKTRYARAGYHSVYGRCRGNTVQLQLATGSYSAIGDEWEWQDRCHLQVFESAGSPTPIGYSHFGIFYDYAPNQALPMPQDTFNNLQTRFEDLQARFDDYRSSSAQGTFTLAQNMQVQDTTIKDQLKTISAQELQKTELAQDKATNGAKITALRENIVALKAAFEIEKQDLRKENTTQRDLLGKDQERVQALSVRVAEQKQTIQRLQEENTKNTIAASELDHENVRLAKVNRDLNNTLAAQITVIGARDQTIGDLTVSTECANETSTQSREERLDAETQRDIAKKETAKAKEETAQAKEETTQAKIEASDARKEAVEATEEMVQAKVEVLKAKTTATACQELLYEFGVKNDDLIKQNERLRSEQDITFSAVNERNWKLNGRVTDLECEIVTLQKENLNTKAQVTQGEQKLQAADQKCSTLTIRIDHQSDLLLEKSGYVLDLEHNLTDLGAKYDLMNTNGEKLFGKFLEQQEVVLSLQMQKHELESHLNSTKMEVSMLNERLAAQSASQKDLLGNQTCEIQSLRHTIEDLESRNIRLEAILRMFPKINQDTEVQLIPKTRRKHRAGKEHAERASRHTQSDSFATPEFVPFGGVTYNALFRFNENAFMVVQDSAGTITRRPTLNFYCLLLLGVKTQPTEKDQLRVLQLLIPVDVTPAHKTLLCPPSVKAMTRSDVMSKLHKISRRRSGTTESLDDMFTKLRVNGPPFGYRPGHRRTTTASLEDTLAGLRIDVPEDCSVVTNISAPGTGPSPAHSLFESTLSVTSDGERNSDSTGLYGSDAVSDTSQDDREIKENSGGKEDSDVEKANEGKEDSKTKEDSEGKANPAKSLTDVNSNGALNLKTLPSAPLHQSSRYKTCNRTTHTICWKCDHCEQRAEPLAKVWGSHTTEACSHNAPSRRAKKREALHAARVAEWRIKEAEKKALNEAYAARFLHHRK